MNIYVGNLSFRCTDEELRQAFAAFGEVTSATIIMDRETGRSRGFGFVEMANDAEGQAAIDGLNGTELGGRMLKINEARPRSQSPAGSGRGPSN
ncbi:MAG: RNA-binding protein [Sedimentisphaerales bacterium]|nr:RNA-binding protein [Sedimentisphaerales bacterium]